MNKKKEKYEVDHIQSVEDLHRLLDENMIGKMVNLTVLRNNIKTKVQVIAGELK